MIRTRIPHPALMVAGVSSVIAGSGLIVDADPRWAMFMIIAGLMMMTAALCQWR